MERAMKVQDVMLQAMAKKITWWQAAEILGISDRHMRRWRERYVEEGYNGLLDRRRGQPSRRRVPLATVEKVFALYREKYFDLNVQHFHEKLEAEHGIELSYTWVKQALQGAGLVARGRKRSVHRKRRQRRPLPGMLLHIDGSRHQWFQDERWYDLIVILDDASSEIYYAQLVEEESTRTVMAALREVPMCQMKGRTPSVLFSLLRPGAHILPHHGFTNVRLICHLPLLVPAKCGMRVGNETRPWHEGKLTIFDDSMEHEAWNSSDELRVVLLFDIWRPELSQIERELITAMMTSIDSFGPRREWTD